MEQERLKTETPFRNRYAFTQAAESARVRMLRQELVVGEEQKGNRHLLIHLLVLLLSRAEVDLGAGEPLASLYGREGKKVPAQEFVVSGGPACCYVKIKRQNRSKSGSFDTKTRTLLFTEHWVKATLSASFEPCVHQQVKPATHLQEAQ